MQLLNKYKKDFDIGFKNFVKCLDILPTQAMNELVFHGLLEDPVYLKWALVNKLSFEYFLKLNNNDILKVFRNLKNPDTTFLYALKNHPEESDFIKSNFPQFILNEYLINRDTAKITVSMQQEARKEILKSLYELMENGKLDSFEWKLPPAEILSGIGHTLNQSGEYKQYYENGILAIQGYLDIRGNRTGIWKSFYPSGSLHSEGYYSVGQKHGPWYFHYLNGTVKSCGSFFHNVKNGDWLVFIPNRNCKTETYINGKLI